MEQLERDGTAAEGWISWIRTEQLERGWNSWREMEQHVMDGTFEKKDGTVGIRGDIRRFLEQIEME